MLIAVPSVISKSPIIEAVLSIASGIFAPVISNIEEIADKFNISLLDVDNVTEAPIALTVRLFIKSFSISRLVILVPVTSNIAWFEVIVAVATTVSFNVTVSRLFESIITSFKDPVRLIVSIKSYSKIRLSPLKSTNKSVSLLFKYALPFGTNNV